jgi:hypothetical protein
MSQLIENADAFVTAVRALRDLPDIARQLSAQLPQAGPEDRHALSTILKALNLPPGTSGPAAGKELEGRLQAEGQKAATEIYRVGIHAKYRADLLSAVGTEGAIASQDFGANGARILQLQDRPPGKNVIAWGPFEKLTEGHPLRSHLSSEDCPTIESNPAVYLGFAAQDLGGSFRPAPSYPLAEVIHWTREAARDQKERDARHLWEKEQERAAEEARKKRTPTIAELAAEIESLKAQLNASTQEAQGKEITPAA